MGWNIFFDVFITPHFFKFSIFYLKFIQLFYISFCIEEEKNERKILIKFKEEDWVSQSINIGTSISLNILLAADQKVKSDPNDEAKIKCTNFVVKQAT